MIPYIIILGETEELQCELCGGTGILTMIDMNVLLNYEPGETIEDLIKKAVRIDVCFCFTEN